MSRTIIAEAPLPLSPDLPFEEGEEHGSPAPASAPEKAPSPGGVRPQALVPATEEVESLGQVPEPAPRPEEAFERVRKPPSELEYINATYSKWDKIRTALERKLLLRFRYVPLNAKAGEYVEKTISPESTFGADTGNYILHGLDVNDGNKHKSFVTSRIDDVDIAIVPKQPGLVEGLAGTAAER